MTVVINYIETNRSNINYQIVLDIVQELLNYPQKTFMEEMYQKLIDHMEKIIHQLE